MRADEACVPVEGGLRQRERGPLRLERRHVGPQQGDLVIDLFDGVLEIETQAAGFSDGAARGGRCSHQIGLGRGNGRLRDIDLHLVGPAIEFHENVALADPVVVLDEHPHDLPGNPRRHEGHIVAHVGVVGGNGVQRPIEPGHADPQAAEQHQDPAGHEQAPARRQAARSRFARRGEFGRPATAAPVHRSQQRFRERRWTSRLIAGLLLPTSTAEISPTEFYACKHESGKGRLRTGC